MANAFKLLQFSNQLPDKCFVLSSQGERQAQVVAVFTLEQATTERCYLNRFRQQSYLSRLLGKPCLSIQTEVQGNRLNAQFRNEIYTNKFFSQYEKWLPQGCA